MGEREKIREREKEKETGLGDREEIIERETGERDWERVLGEREKIIQRERDRIGRKRENSRKRDRGERNIERMTVWEREKERQG